MSVCADMTSVAGCVLRLLTRHSVIASLKGLSTGPFRSQ